jgi:branched-chain amino acid aminotransferase
MLSRHNVAGAIVDIKVWHITSTQNIPLEVDASSLDEVTRQFPEGYYSTFRTFDGCRRVLGLTAHLRRLFDPVSPPEVDARSLRCALRMLLESYRPSEARVRAVMTKQGEVYIAIEHLQLLPRDVYEKGVRVVTTDLHREYPHLKSTTFIARSDSERKHIAQEGIFEALLVKDGHILEGMTSNFFYILREHEESLCTARDDILLGVTRETVIEIAGGRGLEVKYKPLKQEQLTAAAEMFITSSSRGIVPVIQIDEVTVGQGSPGPITKELMSSYEAHVLAQAERI